MNKASTRRRNTPSKSLILKYLQEAKEAVSHEMIEASVGEKMNRVTIYRILNAFEEDGIVHKVVSDNGVAHYALCANNCDHTHNHNHLHNHIHFRCEKCNSLTCMDESVDLKVPKGYQIKSTNLTVSGVCPDCQR
jgi:Fur family ferric uptake transcriptional regulator